LHQIQEISNGFFDILDINLVDSVFIFKDEKVIETTRPLSQEEGLLVFISLGGGKCICCRSSCR